MKQYEKDELWKVTEKIFSSITEAKKLPLNKDQIELLTEMGELCLQLHNSAFIIK